MNAELAGWLPLIQSLGWTLLHFLWQGALIGLAYAAMRWLFPAQRPEARYAAGLIALALMAACPALTLSIIYPQSLAEANEAVPLAADVIVTGVVPAASSTQVAFDHVLPWLVLSWLFGVAIMAARAFHQWHGLERIAKRCARTSPELERMLAALSARFGMIRNIRVLISEHIDTPTLIGWLKPVILVPTAVALGFPRQQVELILAHELGHLRRYDHLVNLAQAVIETLLFYHPMVHWISREVRNDREVCCDRLVLRLTRSEPREYAETLASLEELRFAPKLAVAASGGVLLDRVRRIIDMPAPRLAATRPTFGLAFFLIVALVLVTTEMLRQDRRDLEALANGANAILERLPRPDAAMLVGLALRVDPPKWVASAPTHAKLVVPEEKAMPPRIAAPEASRILSVDALPKPMLDDARTDLRSEKLAPIADLKMTAPKREVSAAAAMPELPPVRASTARAKRLVALHTVSPRYPDKAASADPVRVDVQFAIGTDGKVHDIQLAAGTDSAFGAAAKAALEQWRFDPASVPADGSARFQQSFVFAKPSDVRHRTKAAEGEELDCIRRTGSLICRHPQEEEVGLPLTIIEAGKGNRERGW